MSVVDEIAAERKRQIEGEGWSETHDDEHDCGEMADAAACYALSRHSLSSFRAEVRDRLWPWDKRWWKPKNRRRDLIRAAALLVAEIERLDRRALKPTPTRIGEQ